MARSSVVVTQQKDKLKNLTAAIDNIMRSGISLAEDVMESGDVFVDEVEQCMLELAEMTHTVDGMQEAVKEVDNVLATYSNDKKPPDLGESYDTKLQSVNTKQYDPKNHPQMVRFIQQIKEGCDESEEEMETQDDDDLVLGHVQRSLICPLTKKFYEEPVTSKTCNHTYSKAAILEHIKKRPTCPVCNTSLKESDLKKDDKLQRKVWKAKKQEKKKRESKEGVVKL